MQFVAKMDRQLGNKSKCELITLKPELAREKAALLAQHGFVVSFAKAKAYFNSSEECKKRNEHVEEPRPFLSQNVAQNLASEIIQLVQNLIETNDKWKNVIFCKVRQGLIQLTKFFKMTESLCEENMEEIFNSGKELTSILAILGCFKNEPQEGILCKVDQDEEVSIVTLDQKNSMANVENGIYLPFPVQLWRLTDSIGLSQKSVSLLTPTVAAVVEDVMLETVNVLQVPLPLNVNCGQAVRLISNLRENICKLLALYSNTMKLSNFDMLKNFANDCLPSDRLPIMEKTNRALRAVYINGVRPALLAKEKTADEDLSNKWNASNKGTKMSSAVLEEDSLSVTYHGAGKRRLFVCDQLCDQVLFRRRRLRNLPKAPLGTPRRRLL